MGRGFISWLNKLSAKTRYSQQYLRMMSVSVPEKKPVDCADIKLTPKEAQLRGLLLDVARYINESKEIKDRLELRFAGGWVRDKLLGLPSHDIDTAINAMTGFTFSLKLKEYLAISDNLSRHGLNEGDVGNVHKIAANPAKSKHLETVTTKLLGFDVDFVNLRRETYSADSRNPQMEFGTPKEDALRRDATINALFYNLHTDKVEDFTGGLFDLEQKLIRTPMDPYQTFMDDPLRVLRLIRFASRFNFRIDTDSETCMRQSAIQEALKLKISRERVGVEFERMLKDKDPHHALQLFDRLGLYSTIFTDPTSTNMPEPDTDHWIHSYDCLQAMRANESPDSIYKLLVQSNENAELAWLLAALAPWADASVPYSGKSGSKNHLPLAASVAREGIKANNRICEVVAGAFRHLEEILRLKVDIINGEPYVHERDNVGMSIRRWDASGGQWRLHVILAILVEAMRHDVGNGYEYLFSSWQQFLDHIQKLDVLDAPSWKRPIDGTQLARALGVKPGKWMAGALEVCMAWQFRNPTLDDPKGAIEEVKARAQELQIPLKL